MAEAVFFSDLTEVETKSKPKRPIWTLNLDKGTNKDILDEFGAGNGFARSETLSATRY